MYSCLGLLEIHLPIVGPMWRMGKKVDGLYINNAQKYTRHSVCFLSFSLLSSLFFVNMRHRGDVSFITKWSYHITHICYFHRHYYLLDSCEWVLSDGYIHCNVCIRVWRYHRHFTKVSNHSLLSKTIHKMIMMYRFFGVDAKSNSTLQSNGVRVSSSMQIRFSCELFALERCLIYHVFLAALKVDRAQKNHQFASHTHTKHVKCDKNRFFFLSKFIYYWYFILFIRKYEKHDVTISKGTIHQTELFTWWSTKFNAIEFSFIFRTR